MQFVDVHAHLTDQKFSAILDEVLERASRAGIAAILNTGTDLETSRGCLTLAEKHTSLWAAVGVHPHDSQTWAQATLPELEGMLPHEKVVAIGEIGLDYHYDFAQKDIQKQVFTLQWELAAKTLSTAIVHVREAYDDFFAVIADLKRPPRVLLHCFSGDLSLARRALDLGFDFSIGGPLTYPKRTDTRSVFKFLPIDRIHLETDCPYLAPQSKRGKDNEPSYLPMTFAVLCQVKASPPEKMADQLITNACRLFPKMRIV